MTDLEVAWEEFCKRWAEGDRIQTDAKTRWAEAVYMQGHNSMMRWLPRSDGKQACELGTGELFEPI
jgi:hypothetical protein